MKADDREPSKKKTTTAAMPLSSDSTELDCLALANLEADELTRPEYFFGIAHFYRGEVDRANTWRMRIDTTSNWAVAAAAAFSGFGLAHPEIPHVIVLFGNLVVFALLWIETRRFRVFDVFRARVRKTVENFFGPVLNRKLDSPIMEWGVYMHQDLLNPQFRNTLWEVMGMRLRRNYLFLFVGLLVCWLIKVFVLVDPTTEALSAYERVAALRVPPWLILATLGSFYAFLGVLLFTTRANRRHYTADWGTGKTVKWYDV